MPEATAQQPIVISPQAAAPVIAAIQEAKVMEARLATIRAGINALLQTIGAYEKAPAGWEPHFDERTQTLAFMPAPEQT